MADQVQITINGRALSVVSGTTVAGALALAGHSLLRRSVSGEPRGPLCGMGICMECRVTINRRTQCRSCLTLCAEGMEVRVDE